MSNCTPDIISIAVILCVERLLFIGLSVNSSHEILLIRTKEIIQIALRDLI